ncbi:hypothetical protein [Huintestinicola sp.]|uniref:hypothetical protein n=1 Tax=Huintestinicola sp. TaxID=2981661 RepID=UPI003D7CD106
MEDNMKKTFFVLGIIFIIISVIAFLIGGMFWYASNHTLDGSAGLYADQRGIMMKAFLLGIILLVVGVVFLILSKKMQ